MNKTRASKFFSNNKKELLDEIVPSTRITISNLPPTLDEKQFKSIFESKGHVTDCRIIFKGDQNRRFGFIGYKLLESAVRAVKEFNNSFIGHFKIFVNFAITKKSNSSINIKLDKRPDFEKKEIDNNRLYVYNFPFEITEQDLEKEFEKFGKITSCKIYNKNGISKGFGFITFEEENNAIRAINELDNKIVFGRILHIKPCEKKIGELNALKGTPNIIDNEKSSFKRIKKAKMIERIHESDNWNSTFLNPNTILEKMGQKYGMTKKELLDSEHDNPAIIQTACEKEVLDEVYNFLDTCGFNISILQNSSKTVERSRNIFFIKNLSFQSTKKSLEELFSRYGKIKNIYLADNKSIGVIEFEKEEHAKNAFELVSGYFFKGSLIYMEWAPEQLIKNKTDNSKEVSLVEDESKDNNLKTVFLKNLNFETNESDIENEILIKQIKIPKCVKIVRKDNKSMGFGFVEFNSRDEAESMIKNLQGFMLKGHILQLSLAKSKEDINNDTKNIGKPTDRLMIKNIPFQTTKNELKDLISSIIDIKSIRVPLKSDGSIRGFAFIQFDSIENCKKSLNKLQNIHFYGRKLVFEFSKE